MTTFERRARFNSSTGETKNLVNNPPFFHFLTPIIIHEEDSTNKKPEGLLNYPTFFALFSHHYFQRQETFSAPGQNDMESTSVRIIISDDVPIQN